MYLSYSVRVHSCKHSDVGCPELSFALYKLIIKF